MRDTIEGARRFPETRWTLIASARRSPEQRRVALDELLRLYWKPLYCFARYKGLDRSGAEDAVQGFLARMLERDFLARLDPGKGRLRAYLRTSLNNYLANLHEVAAAQKRGGDVELLPLEFEVAERQLDPAVNDAEAGFDREWALGVMDRALVRLREDFDNGVRGGRFEIVRRFFQPEVAPSYEDAAAGCGMTVSQFKSFLHRTRSRFRALVREEIAATVLEPNDIDQEVAELVRVLSA